jgi:thiamine pyrophosphate-dependent acetolactate synthase large subunit-like protein
VLSGASTYALGEVFKKHFETGGTFLDFDPSRLKKFYQEKFEKGKTVATDLKKEQEKQEETPANVTEEEVKTAEEFLKKEKNETNNTSKEDIISKMKEIAALKDAGIITEEEFSTMKARLIQHF